MDHNRGRKDISYLLLGDNKQKQVYAAIHTCRAMELLSEYDQSFRDQVIRLKEKGFSTEEAFCTLLGIEGDPYIELLKLETRNSNIETNSTLNTQNSKLKTILSGVHPFAGTEYSVPFH